MRVRLFVERRLLGIQAAETLTDGKTQSDTIEALQRHKTVMIHVIHR